MNKELTTKKSWQGLMIISLISLAISERLWFDLGPNVELVTLVTLVAAMYIGKKAALIVSLAVLALSDMVMGNTNILLFTWSAYLVIALGAMIIKRLTKSPTSRIVGGTLGGQVASVWFYLWTNFGVWLLDSWGMYPDTFDGLILSYINGLPFLKNQLIGNLLLVPFGLFFVEGVGILAQKISHLSLVNVLRRNHSSAS